MSSEATPISPARFAEAVHDLPITSLHLKVTELRNSIARLDYSNEELRPFALGLEKAIDPTSPPTASSTPPSSTSAPVATTNERRAANGGAEPDQDCIDAITENEQVISRMEERINLIKVEVERRGLSWDEFKSPAEAAPIAEDTAEGTVEGEVETAASRNGVAATNGTQGGETRSSPWTDGTFQTGVIRNGEVIMDSNSRAGSFGGAGDARGVGGAGDAGGAGDFSQDAASTTTRQAGGSLTDEELRRSMEEQMRRLGDDDDDDDGMHL